jgi:hypothetical protein
VQEIPAKVHPFGLKIDRSPPIAAKVQAFRTNQPVRVSWGRNSCTFAFIHPKCKLIPENCCTFAVIFNQQATRND